MAIQPDVATAIFTRQRRQMLAPIIPLLLMIPAIMTGAKNIVARAIGRVILTAIQTTPPAVWAGNLTLAMFVSHPMRKVKASTITEVVVRTLIKNATPTITKSGWVKVVACKAAKAW